MDLSAPMRESMPALRLAPPTSILTLLEMTNGKKANQSSGTGKFISVVEEVRFIFLVFCKYMVRNL